MMNIHVHKILQDFQGTPQKEDVHTKDHSLKFAVSVRALYLLCFIGQDHIPNKLNQNFELHLGCPSIFNFCYYSLC